MNYMKQVAQMLGVELEKEFKLNDDYHKYKLNDKGLVMYECGEWTVQSLTFTKLLNGQYEIIKPILDEKEKEYLSYVIRPFRSEIISIYKQRSDSHRNEWININFKNDMEMVFPSFRNGTMYKGMELEKKYTLEELGL